ncbi:cytochrome d ubiquinol oxidase subunit II [Bailinhaonella thermotolerans]|uniref:Cytochrome d ubiquinol oxidase subunit II n=1 Tax=Bailinhaonella thermotolerans TaxID=1070861 RepID=A0A3A4AWG7_9ACTN|nr:cytochrome d ubiquinol oxidase subunit II [Bailinhaonella thermotolerans]RJL32647.1 cytochrome d ubiquinol oxidase subunit II [Bailinhaonella thermotolerans]
MEMIAIGLLGFFVLGYLLLAGSDIGVGMTLPVLGRADAERRVVIAAIAPFFLGNEVWLVAVVGLLAGMFPDLEGDLLSGLGPAVVVLLLGWIARDMGLWSRGRVDRRSWRVFWDGAIVAGSWTLALTWGWILAGVLAGDVAGPTPVRAVFAVVIAAVFAVHGLAFAALRLRGPARERARTLSGPSGEGATFGLTSAALAVLGVLAGLRLPLADTVADAGTLAFLVPAVLIILPFLVGAQAWVWWIFRHRVEGPSYL